MSGGELFAKIVQKEQYLEGEAQKVVKTIAEVLAYLHARDIAHRDLKPENVLLSNKSDDAVIKIADFGFARKVRDGCITACGTPGYVAPEVISGKVYSTQCDDWSLGVLTYILLAGYPPFYAKNRQELFKAIRHAKYVFDSPYWDVVSDPAKDLVSKILVVDPKKRMTAKDILAHPWVEGKVSSKQNITASKNQLKIANARRHLRTAFRGAMAAGQVTDMVATLRKEMQKN